MNKINNAQVFIEEPIIIKNIPKIETFDFIKDKYRNTIEAFYNELKNKLTYDNLITFYQNIKELEIIDKYNLSTILKSILSEGSYDFRNNKIRLYNKKPQNEDVLKHELLHMSTRRIEENKCHIGFLQVQPSYYIGNAINEGYTDIMCKKIFSNYHFTIAYTYQIQITKIIEQIITKEKMQDLYFSSNLYELTNILSKYNTINNITNFLIQMDYVLTPYYHKELIDVLIEINSFIFETFTNYLIYTSQELPIIEEKYEYFINELYKGINTFTLNKDLLNRNLVYNTNYYKKKIKNI